MKRYWSSSPPDQQPFMDLTVERNETWLGSCAIMPRHMQRMISLVSSLAVLARTHPSNVITSRSSHPLLSVEGPMQSVRVSTAASIRVPSLSRSSRVSLLKALSRSSGVMNV